MTDEDMHMKTSEIAARLQHASTAVTRAWLRKHELVAESRDAQTGEKVYLRSTVEDEIAKSVRRGPYRKARPSAEGSRHDGDRGLPPATGD